MLPGDAVRVTGTIAGGLLQGGAPVKKWSDECTQPTELGLVFGTRRADFFLESVKGRPLCLVMFRSGIRWFAEEELRVVS